jgi:hypothetical protein
VVPTKEERQPGTAQGTPATGRRRTAQGRRPLRGVALCCLFWIQGLFPVQGCGFP